MLMVSPLLMGMTNALSKFLLKTKKRCDILQAA